MKPVHDVEEVRDAAVVLARAKRDFEEAGRELQALRRQKRESASYDNAAEAYLSGDSVAVAVDIATEISEAEKRSAVLQKAVQIAAARHQAECDAACAAVVEDLKPLRGKVARRILAALEELQEALKAGQDLEAEGDRLGLGSSRPPALAGLVPFSEWQIENAVSHLRDHYLVHWA